MKILFCERGTLAASPSHKLGFGAFGINFPQLCMFQPLTMFLPTIAAGAFSSYFIDTNYQCWTCGGSEHITVPEKEKYVTDQEVKLVARTPGNLFLLLGDGKVARRDNDVWGYSDFEVIDGLPEIEMLAAGELFALFLDADGNTWITGSIKDYDPYKYIHL